jgi:acyl-CoA synthetase (AMP-forming)/AMP-acid ligase II
VVDATSERDLIEICRRNLVPYKIPKAFVVIDEFPRTAAGKVLKPELLRQFQSSASHAQVEST